MVPLASERAQKGFFRRFQCETLPIKFTVLFPNEMFQITQQASASLLWGMCLRKKVTKHFSNKNMAVMFIWAYPYISSRLLCGLYQECSVISGNWWLRRKKIKIGSDSNLCFISMLSSVIYITEISLGTVDWWKFSEVIFWKISMWNFTN